jgi:CelD/BcsL family acetyltransferase involved in cellulose biosynthesis
VCPANPSEHGGALQYAVLRDLAEVEAIAAQWNTLLEQSPCNRAFSAPQWFVASCRYNPEYMPFVLTARRGKELAGVLPLALQERTGIIDFPSAMSDYNDVIAGAEDLAVPSGLLQSAMSRASGHQLSLSNVRPDSNCARAAADLAGRLGIEAGYHPGKNCFYIQLPNSFAGYLATRSRIFRKGLARTRRNAQRAGLEVRPLTPVETQPDEVVELFLSLNLSRFESRSGFAPKSVQQFVREVLPSLFIQGKMTALALVDGGRVLAIDLCMRGQSSICSWNGGFLPEAARWSPGRLLFAAGIEHAVAAGLLEYDLLRGSHAYKASWATQSRTIGKLEFTTKALRIL